MKRRTALPALRFSTQTLLLQLGVVALVVLLSSAVHAWLTYDRLGREAENQALTLARTVASDPSVRSQVPHPHRGAVRGHHGRDRYPAGAPGRGTAG